jgi:spore coat protein U-like protein
MMFVLPASLGTAVPASALTCSGTFTMEFGEINALDGPDETTTSNVTVTCNGGIPDAQVRACVAIEAPRQLSWNGGSGTIDYNLSDTAGGVSWPSQIGSSSPSVTMTLDQNGTGSNSSQLVAHGAIAFPQAVAPTQKANTRYFDAPSVTVTSALAAGHSDCSTILTNSMSTPASVGADYVPACHLTTNPLNFGTLSSTLSAVDAATSITARCSNETLFTVGMNYGANGGVDPSVRYMRNGDDFLTYGIYLDSGRAQGWGYTLGVNVYNGTGTGSQVTIPVYGRIKAQPTPPSGTYTDTVIVTIEY